MAGSDSGLEDSPWKDPWRDLMPSRLPTGRRSYAPADPDPALELLQDYSHQDRFQEELGRGLDLLWEAAAPDLAEEEQKQFEEYANEVGVTESWLLLDFALADQCTVLDHFLMERGEILEIGQRNFLLDLRDTHLSLFEVREVVEGRGFVGTDLWSGDRYRIYCPEHCEFLVPWDLLTGRLLCRPDGTVMFEFGTYSYAAGSTVELLNRLRQHHEWLLSYEPNLSARTFLKRIGFLFHHLMIEFRGGERPSFLFPEGSLISLRTYRCPDPELAVLILEQARESFLAVRRQHWVFKNQSGDSKTLDPRAAQIRIRGGSLQTAGLEVMDLERLEERLLTLIPHSLELIENKRLTIESFRESESARLEPLSGTLDEVHAHMRSQLEDWLGNPMPEYENRSPLECVGNGEHMLLILDQLKAFENRESRNPMHAEGRYDFAWVWGRLGLGTDHP